MIIIIIKTLKQNPKTENKGKLLHGKSIVRKNYLHIIYCFAVSLTGCGFSKLNKEKTTKSCRK